MNKKYDLLIHIADIFAIPCFYLLFLYFKDKKKKNFKEYILYLFSITGLILDVLFTYFYFCN